MLMRFFIFHSTWPYPSVIFDVHAIRNHIAPDAGGQSRFRQSHIPLHHNVYVMMNPADTIAVRPIAKSMSAIRDNIFMDRWCFVRNAQNTQ